ncbi:MAG TPA: ankyrin repeat domain-containing protein [Trebonia sp.]
MQGRGASFRPVVADRGLEALLRADPALASLEGGPYRWEPILYLAYARHDPAVSEDATIRSARLLLDHGADPNAGYLWHGLIPAFTALTGALGSGEGDQPRHPHGLVLATVLLSEFGWDVNARARADAPVEQEWETALHEAAGSGEIDAARMLIELGADPRITDARFNAMPLGWAEHFGQHAMADYLRPRTPPQ